MNNEEKFERLGELIDSLDSLACALSLPLSPQIHVQQLSSILPKRVIELRQVYVDITGENPWE